ncbi:hypothetical protein PC9H_009925 [Pleurotus ostreatus]|uniref:HNH nuclease domain-containing protein n=1 Tax=Pleurotus ostreatus TaxID=5322 RepID=A0A8H7DQ27_PLEOS|nr:uncharacterized protein PC9H_009925 [Pleurotus ostreatus]KAF7424617.1 hypothetical protein PC9H_009925 [Pleurotus ostreatus]KAJ8692409.1 hypothetical protein PTI98_009725 [Pleurotus ostreatus]
MSNSQLEDTLDSRSTRSLNIAARVNAVCPHKDRCLLQNLGPESGIQYAHVVPRALAQDDELMNKLEWYWGMARRTIDLDTCYNMFPCGAQFHISHDALRWGLLPSDDIVAQYHDSLTRVHSEFYAERTNFPNIPDGNFSYRFLPLRDMELVPIIRLRMPTPGNSLGPSDTVTHYFPFDTMPILTSHIHPKFAIFELGRQIAAFPMDVKIKLINTTPILCSILDIFRAWSESPPAGFLADTAFNPHPDDDDDEDEDCSDAGTIPQRELAPLKKSPQPGKTGVRTLRVLRDRVGLRDRTLRVKEWVDKTQLALKTHPSPPSSLQLSDSPLQSRNTDITATSPCLANDYPAGLGSNVPVDLPDAEVLFEIGQKRLLDGEDPASKKQKTLVDEGVPANCKIVDTPKNK